jgi:hypothetical protein
MCTMVPARNILLLNGPCADRDCQAAVRAQPCLDRDGDLFRISPQCIYLVLLFLLSEDHWYFESSPILHFCPYWNPERSFPF